MLDKLQLRKKSWILKMKFNVRRVNGNKDTLNTIESSFSKRNSLHSAKKYFKSSRKKTLYLPSTETVTRATPSHPANQA